MNRGRSSLDLVATASLALLGLLAALLEVEPAIRVVLALPMALLLPGYALAAVLLPRRSVPVAERAIYALALSIVVTVLSGVVVQLVLGLDRVVWAFVLAFVTVAICLRAERRRGGGASSGDRSLPSLPSLAPSWPISLLAIVAAVGMAGWAISLASSGARNERDQYRFTELWVLPAGGSGAEDTVSIGVASHRRIRSSYHVRVASAGAVLATRIVQLDPGERWHTVLRVPGIGKRNPLEVTLRRKGSVYRRVYLKSGKAL
jgi:uncharacterized membrane protein